MKTLNYIIIEVEDEYNNEVELESGLNLVVNTTIESVANINRVAKIKAAPSSTILLSGDEIIFHHNILRRKNDVDGVEVKGDYYIKDNLFFVPPTEIFAYKRNGEWKALDPYVFVTPILAEGTSEGVIEGVSFNKYEPNTGIIQLINKELTEWGLKKEDKVFFKDDSEYEFEIDGKVHYRMKTDDILGKYE